MNPACIHPLLYSSPLVFIPPLAPPVKCITIAMHHRYARNIPPPLDDINVGADALEQVSR